MADVFIVAGIKGVHTECCKQMINTSLGECDYNYLPGPGHTALTRMPCLICWLDRPLVNEMSAPLVEV